MRSIHKKTLKRFLSTLLALTMVLGMVPFTALALPVGETAGQVSNADLILDGGSTPLADWKVSACVLKSDVQARTASESEPQTTTVHAEFTLPKDLSSADYKIQIGTGMFTLNVSTNGVGEITNVTPTSATNGGIAFTIAADATDNTKLKVTAVGVSLGAGYGSKDVNIVVTSASVEYKRTMQVTVPRKADLTVTATPDEVTAGQDFTVTATSDIADGYVKFTYGADDQRVAVIPDENGRGIASATFTATETAGTQTVTALQYEMTSVVNTKKTANITVTAADTYWDVTFMVDGLQYGEKQSVKDGEKAIRPVDPLVADGKVFAGWYTDNTFANVFDFATETITANTTVYAKVVDKLTITFLPGAVDAYIPFSPTTVSVKSGESCTIPAAPTRPGYTFAGWDSDNNGVVDIAADVTATGTVSGDMTLNALWEVEKVNITYPLATDIDGVHAISKTTGLVAKGSTVYFTIELDAGYDPSTMVVKAGDQTLAPVKAATDLYQYSFVANAATGVTITAPSKLTYTVMMPVGHFTAKITAANGAPITPAAASASINHGSGYTFTVTPATGYEIKGVYVNGVAQTSGSPYTVTSVTSAQTVEVVVDEIPSYTVTYVVNSAQYTTQKVMKGGTSSVSDPVVTGYTFEGWVTTNGGDTSADLTNIASDKTVYAKLTPVSYTITYNRNAGSETVGNMPTTTPKTHGTAVALDSEIPTRDGYTFLGWSTSSSANTPSYQPGEMYSNEGDVTLYAVWQIKTFTVTLPNGTGYTAMPATNSSSPVNYKGSFSFTVTVDPEYAVATPVVKANSTDLTGTRSGNTYTYTISEITTDQVVSIQVTRNSVYTVTFQYTIGSETTIYQTQQVEHNAKATVPNPPSVEGYTFGGWQWDDDNVASTPMVDFSFATSITKDITLYAVMTPITPAVTWDAPAANAGWTFDVTSADVTVPASDDIDVSPNTVKYGSKMEFNVVVKKGYDATNLAVAANGLALNPVLVTENGDGTTTYSFILSNITADQKITVTGVVRKTVTITYNANARDDVSGMPEQQVVKYYLASDYDTIINQIPVRTGYTFLGWCTNSKATAADTKYTKALIEANNAIADFTKDTTLYAIWEANSTSISLAVSDVAVAAGTGTNAKEYEGQPVTLTATLKDAGGNALSVSTGSVNFYQNDKLLISVPANGSSTYTTTATTSPYKLDGTPVEDSYQVEYKAESDEGYGSADKTAPVKVTVLSTAITWELDASKKVDGTDKLTVYDKDGAEVASGIMEANNVYTLKIPTVKDLNGETLTVGTDYVVEWIYKDEKGVETKYTKDVNGDSAVISAEYSKYQFRAVVTPVKDAARSVYNKAAGYNLGVLADDDAPALYTQWTEAVDRKQTKTALTIEGAVNENQQVAIDGAEVDFGAAHWAQFEGDELVLKAAVTIEGETTPVSAGYVDFYRYNADDTWTKLNADPVAVDKNTGIATFGDDYNEAVRVKAYVDGTGSNADEAKANVDKFFAVYLANATWETSASTGVTYTSAGAIDTVTPPADDDVVYIKSTTIKTPVIDVKRGATEKGNTTYTADLTGLIAGVEYTLTLREDGANTTDEADWSVVALDGRTVAKTDYTIQWYTGTPTTDPAKVDLTMGTGATYSVENPAKDDYFYVELTAQNNMDKGEKSKKVIIDAKQDVNVSVVASDEIKSTAETDVYQLNMITLTATVTAKEDDAAEQPTDGLVGFYYQPYSGAKWVKIGESKALTTEDGKTFAEIETDVLPVDAAKNTKQTVKVLAVYEGNDTFNASHEVASDNSVSQKTTGTVEIEEVTVYSSVVLVHAAEENKAVISLTDGGIHISAEDGKVLANETRVNLKLSDVYTLDYNKATVGTVDLSKLAYGTEADYTVQWQKLSNAASYASDYADEEVPWQPITSANGTICQIDVEDGAAYRAVITVNNTPIAKGSYTKVDQDIDGRQVYYSNILVANPAPPTVTVNVNTSNTTDGYEGIVEGETVTIHTFASGATGTTPISELTTTVTKDGASEPIFSETKTNVNGHVSFDWTAAKPGYYELKVVAKFTNGYSEKTITRTLIVRDDNYGFNVTENEFVYDGQVQGLELSVTDMGIENALAQKSVVVYYYDATGAQVEPTQAGTYKAVIRLQESAYWTEKTENVTFTIKQREVSVVDLIAQAKVYDGTNNVNIQEIILEDAATDQGTTGLPTSTTGVINGDSVYATVENLDVKLSSKNAGANAIEFTIKSDELKGDDAGNYKLVAGTYTGEAINVQRSQVKGDIADATYKYGTTRVPAEDIYLIDQAGTVLGAEDYTVTYYYHSGNGVKQVSAMNWKGMYTVIARPDQDNYKGGAAQTIYVADAAVDADPVKTAKSALISITNTVELFGDANNQGIQATATKGTAVVKYNVGGVWVDTAPTAAGRYLVKVTAEENSAVIGTAYGLYTVVKTYPDYSIEAADADYNSAQYAESNITTNVPAGTYFTYTGGTIQGVAYEAPTEVGTYVVTAHIPEGTDAQGTVAHEISDTFEIKPIALKITADSLQRRQYGAFPDMTASFDGLATGGVAVDTSLRDVQIQPELIFNAAYSNDAMDQVGSYTITPVAALARNYVVKAEDYVPGIMTVTADEPNPVLAIHGMIDSSDGEVAYYGDKIQLYAYGSQNAEKTKKNNSSVLDWSVTGLATISPDGLLEITGVGTVVVTLKRGIGAQQIETTLTIDARKQEVKVEVPNVDLVYTGADRNYSGVGTPKAIDAKLTDVAVSDITVANNVRGVIGSQIVTGKVADTVALYQSETYGGLFTINDAEIVVAPKAVSTTYGTAATMSNVYDTGYTETTRVAGGTAALTGAVVASIADAYSNLDAGTYEILVAGTEDMNYNVKYTTNPNAEVVTVTALENTLKYTTGVIADSTGRTSGSAIDASGFNPDEGAVVTYADPTVAPNDRMYGEPNPAMNYLFTGLITGDSAADLVKLIELVGFVPGIDKEANVAFTDAHISASGVATGKSGTYLSGKSYYETTTALPVNGVKNYLMTDTDFTFGIQNVYQRPFTLKLTGNKTELRVYKPLVINGSTVNTTKLLEIILDNMEVVEYESGGKKYGGLATKLGHTINDVNLEIVSATYNSVAGTINVELKCNDNYWLSNKNWTIVVDPSMITVSYGTLGKYSSSVTMYGIDEHGNNIGATNVSGKVWYEIYVEDTSLERKYSNYKDLTPVVRVQMTKGSGKGVYVANYNSTPLSAGHYVMFAIAEDYTIIE